MQFSFNLFGSDQGEWLSLVQRADQLGFDAVWFADHVITPTHYAPNYPYSATGRPMYTVDTPIMDPWISIAYMAGLTKRIKFGTGVYILPERNPVLTARIVASAQYYSGGRVIFGVGAGWMEEEYQAVGENFHNRGKRMDEMVEIIRLLWSGKAVEYKGELYSFPEVRFVPAPSPAIPIIFGGETDAALNRAARVGDGWFGLAGTLEHTLGLVKRLDEFRKQAGRDHEPFQYWARCSDLTLEEVKRFEAAGLPNLTLTVMADSRDKPLQYKLDALERFANGVIGKIR
jgi:probable F420-dependent oxidoreductase